MFAWATILGLYGYDVIKIEWNWLQPSFLDDLVKMGPETAELFIAPSRTQFFLLCYFHNDNIFKNDLNISKNTWLALF